MNASERTDQPPLPPGGRPAAATALRAVIVQLDAAMPTIQHRRPRQASRWERTGRAEFLYLAEQAEGRQVGLDVVWDVVGDLRSLAQEARELAAAEGLEVTW